MSWIMHTSFENVNLRCPCHHGQLSLNSDRILFVEVEGFAKHFRDTLGNDWGTILPPDEQFLMPFILMLAVFVELQKAQCVAQLK